MELVYRNLSGYMEEVKIVELPYCRDSREDHLNTAYSACESASPYLDAGMGLLLALLGGVEDDDDDDDDGPPSLMPSQLL